MISVAVPVGDCATMKQAFVSVGQIVTTLESDVINSRLVLSKSICSVEPMGYVMKVQGVAVATSPTMASYASKLTSAMRKMAPVRMVAHATLLQETVIAPRMIQQSVVLHVRRERTVLHLDARMEESVGSGMENAPVNHHIMVHCVS